MTRPVRRLDEDAGARPAVVVPSDYLGPAEAIARDGLDVDVRLPNGAVARARHAMPIAYESVPGDQLLVIGRGADHYVIGVLSGRGRASLAFPGDVDLHAGGELRLTGDAGVTVRAPDVDVVAHKLRVTAETLVETLASAYHRISGLFSQRLGSSHTIVEGEAYTQAKDAVLLTEETVTVNGKQIRLG